jgi:hypothetical protein
MDQKKIDELKKYWVKTLTQHIDSVKGVSDILRYSTNFDNLELCQKLDKVHEFLISLPLYMDMIRMAEQKEK